MILCPAMLREKWKEELENRFGIQANIQDAKEILSTLKKSFQQGALSNFAIVGSLQGLRPPRLWRSEKEKTDRVSAQLARFLDEHGNQEPLIDLLVIDEAHYMRNIETVTSQLGRLLRHVSEYIILLSATPIHLKSLDLYQLLNLVDEDTFNQSRVFDDILLANAPLIKIRDLVISGKVTIEQFVDILKEASHHPFLINNRQLQSLLQNLPTKDELSDYEFRSNLAYRLEVMNLLGHVVARTRKREVTEWRVIREVVPEKIALTPAERVFYEAVTELVRKFCLEHEKHEGFLLVMPQRQITSSMVAALREWQKRSMEYDQMFYEDVGYVREDPDEKPGPVVSEIIKQAFELADLSELTKNDSKYERLQYILKNHLKKS